MSNLDEESIKKEAKHVIDKFANALSKAGIKENEDFFVDRKEFERVEGCGKASLEQSKASHSFNEERGKNSAEQSSVVCKNFKKELLKNAPQHDDDFVIAEKGGWK